LRGASRYLYQEGLRSQRPCVRIAPGAPRISAGYVFFDGTCFFICDLIATSLRVRSARNSPQPPHLKINRTKEVRCAVSAHVSKKFSCLPGAGPSGATTGNGGSTPYSGRDSRNRTPGITEYTLSENGRSGL